MRYPHLLRAYTYANTVGAQQPFTHLGDIPCIISPTRGAEGGGFTNAQALNGAFIALCEPASVQRVIGVNLDASSPAARARLYNNLQLFPAADYIDVYIPQFKPIQFLFNAVGGAVMRTIWAAFKVSQLTSYYGNYRLQMAWEQGAPQGGGGPNDTPPLYNPDGTFK